MKLGKEGGRRMIVGQGKENFAQHPISFMHACTHSPPDTGQPRKAMGRKSLPTFWRDRQAGTQGLKAAILALRDAPEEEMMGRKEGEEMMRRHRPQPASSWGTFGNRHNVLSEECEATYGAGALGMEAHMGG